MSKHEELKELALLEQFTDQEWSDRKRYISTLRNFANAGIAAAEALTQIRDKKLYRPHSTLKEFVERECGLSKPRAYQLFKFTEVRAALPAKSLPLVDSERKARELAKIPEEKRVEALDKAVGNGKITAKSIKRVAAEIVDAVEDDMGYPITKNAMQFWNRKSEVQEILSALSKARTRLSEIEDGDPLFRRVNSVRSKLEKLNEYYNEFKGALPAYVCYSCDGLNVQNCRLCGGTGVVSEFEWKSKADPEGHNRREKAIKKLKHPF